MSQWTHVAGLIRVDTLDGIAVRRDTETTLHSLISASTLPTGSEEPLRLAILPTRRNNSLNWGHISVWGDLRDYGNARQVEELSEWFRLLCQALVNEHYIIRQAVLLVEVERAATFVLSASPELGDAKVVVRVVSVPIPVAA